jgi:DNA-binding transcriptional regulator YiaG
MAVAAEALRVPSADAPWQGLVGRVARLVDRDRRRTGSLVSVSARHRQINLSVAQVNPAQESEMLSAEKSKPVANTAAVEAFRRRFAVALARRVGAGGRIPVKQFCHLVGVSEQLVGQWIAGSKLPSGARLVMVINLLGPDFAHEILSPHGMGVYSLADQRAAERARRVAGFAQAVRAFAQVLPAFEDEPEFVP